jgi:hypothetical protein
MGLGFLRSQSSAVYPSSDCDDLVERNAFDQWAVGLPDDELPPTCIRLIV